VTLFLRENLPLFDVVHVGCPVDYSNYDWRVDHPTDIAKIREVYEWMGERPMGYRDIIAFLKEKWDGKDDVADSSGIGGTSGGDSPDHGPDGVEKAGDPGNVRWFTSATEARDGAAEAGVSVAR